MFIIDIEYTVEFAHIDPWIDEHFDFLERHYKAGRFVVSGRKEPRTGGIIVVKNESREYVEELIQEDPFYRENLADYKITEFIPGNVGIEFESLLDT